jgi:hypothetical protein
MDSRRNPSRGSDSSVILDLAKTFCSLLDLAGLYKGKSRERDPEKRRARGSIKGKGKGTFQRQRAKE